MKLLTETRVELKELIIEPKTLKKGIDKLKTIINPNSEKYEKFHELISHYRTLKGVAKPSKQDANRIRITDEFIKPIIRLISKLECSDLESTQLRGILDKRENSFKDYAIDWDKTIEWLDNYRESFVDIVIAEMKYNKVILNHEEIISLRLELIQLINWIKEFFEKEPTEQYSVWFRNKLENADFESIDYKLLTAGLLTFVSELQERAEKFGISNNVVLFIEDYFGSAAGIQERYLNQKVKSVNSRMPEFEGTI